MKADRNPMRMDDLRDPEAEWDEERNRGMCKFIVWYAAICTTAICLVAWLAQ